MKKTLHLPVIAYTIKPGQNTEIVLPAAPGAICILREEGTKGKKSDSVTLVTGANGRVRIYLKPYGKWGEDIARLILEYVANERKIIQPVAIRINKKATAEMPFCKPETPGSVVPDSRLLPALNHKEIKNLTNEELLERGYPMRPDYSQARGAYAAWKLAVSTPSILVDPHTVAHPNASASAETTDEGWSGYELMGAEGRTYDWITATWIVPWVMARMLGGDYSCIWVGIDNGIPDLVQAGTEQDCKSLPFAGSRGLLVSSYYAWNEFLPVQSTQHVITAIDVHPGDQMYVQVWVGNLIKPKKGNKHKAPPVSSLPDLKGNTCFFYLKNMTTGKTTTTIAPRGSTIVSGNEAEWVIERTTLVGEPLPGLANYGSCVVAGVSAHDANTGMYVAYQRVPNVNITMVAADGTALSQVGATGASSMEFVWKAYGV
jgi:peptidase A4-like protein